jgi:hypothetical protein
MRPDNFYRELFHLVENYNYQKRLLFELNGERNSLKGKMIENEKNFSYREREFKEAKLQLDEFLNNELSGENFNSPIPL